MSSQADDLVVSEGVRVLREAPLLGVPAAEPAVEKTAVKAPSERDFDGHRMESQWKTNVNQRKSNGKPMENPWKTNGTLVENHGNQMEI